MGLIPRQLAAALLGVAFANVRSLMTRLLRLDNARADSGLAAQEFGRRDSSVKCELSLHLLLSKL